MRDVMVTAGIRLGQFLKVADAVQAGGEVKAMLADGLVSVNDQPELRRGRQLADGDVVTVSGQSLRVSMVTGE
ncbi:RNA-binding S4 domain-containing protein [Dermatophilaceae bacterium Soc4.6]